MTTWLRRNRWYLLALVVLIPGALAVSLVPRFFPYLADLPQYESVARGETVRYSGADIQLTDLEVLDGETIAAPLGSDVVVASFTIDVVEPLESAYCELVVVSSEGGVERRWDEQAYLNIDYEIPDGVEESCTLDEAGSYRAQFTFVVPHGEVADPAVELSSSAESPRVLRLH
jgi:hypothetical protein